MLICFELFFVENELPGVLENLECSHRSGVELNGGGNCKSSLSPQKFVHTMVGVCMFNLN